MPHLLISSVRCWFNITGRRSLSTSVKDVYIPSLKCSEWSKKVFDVINKNYPLQRSIICLDDPGNSLTEAFLNTNSKHIVVCGSNIKWNLKNLREKYPDKLSHAPYRYGERFAKVLKGLNLSGIEKVMLLDCSHLNIAIFNYLDDFVKSIAMWKIAPVNLFVFVDEDECNSIQQGTLSCGMNSLTSLTFCNLFLNHKILLEVPPKAFETNDKPNKKKSKNKFLLGFSLKEEVSNASEMERLDMGNMMMMMRHLNRKRIKRFIPLIESELCNDIGMDLIEEGIGMMDERKDIPPHMWPKIFKIIISHPNYKLREHILKSATQESP